MLSAPSPLVIIDDDEDDRFILSVVLQKAGVANPLAPFGNPEDAIAFLTSASMDANGGATLPLACFVDARMHGFNGFEFIEWVRNHAVFERMALIVTSSSDHPQDLETAAKLGAQCYVLKYPVAAAMRDLVRECEDFRARPHGRRGFALPCNLFLGRERLPKLDAGLE